MLSATFDNEHALGGKNHIPEPTDWINRVLQSASVRRERSFGVAFLLARDEAHWIECNPN